MAASEVGILDDLLHKTACVGSVGGAVKLLATGLVDIDRVGPNNQTPLMAAAGHGHSHIVRLLLNKGANVSAANDGGDTALHSATREGQLASTRLLVEAGPDLNAVNRKGWTPLHVAASLGHWEIVRVLAGVGANINSRMDTGATPLYCAALCGQLQAVRELLRAKADPLLVEVYISGEEREEIAPLYIAAKRGHVEVVRELVHQRGIDGCGGESAGLHALWVAAYEPHGHHVDVMAALIDAGVVDTGIALHCACQFGAVASVKVLLQRQREVWGASGTRGAYVDNPVEPHARTPLISSISSCHSRSPKVARLLVDAGADATSGILVTCGTSGKPFTVTLTPLGLVNHYLSDKIVGAKEAATEEQLNCLEAIRRMLLRVEAVHAISWLWPSGGSQVGSGPQGYGNIQTNTTTDSVLRAMLPMMRRRARRRGMVWSSVFRHSEKPAQNGSRGFFSGTQKNRPRTALGIQRATSWP